MSALWDVMAVFGIISFGVVVLVAAMMLADYFRERLSSAIVTAVAMSLWCCGDPLFAQHYVQHVQHHANHVATYCPPHQQTLVLPVATFFPVYGAPYYGHGGGAQRQAAPEDAERIAKIETNVAQLTANVTQLTAAVTQLAEALKKKE